MRNATDLPQPNGFPGAQLQTTIIILYRNEKNAMAKHEVSIITDNVDSIGQLVMTILNTGVYIPKEKAGYPASAIIKVSHTEPVAVVPNQFIVPNA